MIRQRPSYALPARPHENGHRVFNSMPHEYDHSRIWPWVIVICIALGFVGSAGDLILAHRTVWRAIFAATGNWFLSFGAATALILAAIQLKEEKR